MSESYDNDEVLFPELTCSFVDGNKFTLYNVRVYSPGNNVEVRNLRNAGRKPKHDYNLLTGKIIIELLKRPSRHRFLNKTQLVELARTLSGDEELSYDMVRDAIDKRLGRAFWNRFERTPRRRDAPGTQNPTHEPHTHPNADA